MERIFSTIPSVLSATSNDDATKEALVFAAWKNVAGELLGRQTQPVRLAGTQLTVAVNDAVWQRNLVDLAPGFIARLNRIAGDRTVTFIDFAVDPKRVGANDNAERSLAPALELSSSLIDSADAIADEKLRENFLATAAEYLARQGR